MLHAQKKHNRRECLEVVDISISVDDKIPNQLSVTFWNELDVPCGLEDLKDCHIIKGYVTIIKFSSRRKSSGVLRKRFF